MNMATWYNSQLLIVISTIAFLMMTVSAAPVETDDDQPDNGVEMRSGTDLDYLVPWESLNSVALHKLLMQLDADERLSPRVGRSWPPAIPRDWGLRSTDGRFARQWRADKRQVRFRQCYFNPISCFRK